jgi:hypothetical protein
VSLRLLSGAGTKCQGSPHCTGEVYYPYKEKNRFYKIKENKNGEKDDDGTAGMDRPPEELGQALGIESRADVIVAQQYRQHAHHPNPHFIGCRDLEKIQESVGNYQDNSPQKNKIDTKIKQAPCGFAHAFPLKINFDP